MDAALRLSPSCAAGNLLLRPRQLWSGWQSRPQAVLPSPPGGGGEGRGLGLSSGTTTLRPSIRNDRAPSRASSRSPSGRPRSMGQSSSSPGSCRSGPERGRGRDGAAEWRRGGTGTPQLAGQSHSGRSLQGPSGAAGRSQCPAGNALLHASRERGVPAASASRTGQPLSPSAFCQAVTPTGTG